MNELSNKAKIVMYILEKLEATNPDNKTNIYIIMEKLNNISLKDVLPNEEDYELDCIQCEMTQKSVSTTLASLVRKGLVEKTGVISTKVNGVNKNIRNYFVIKN